ncbi:MAG: hypothetical protein Q9218_005854 [Villophora microphyllina]
MRVEDDQEGYCGQGKAVELDLQKHPEFRFCEGRKQDGEGDEEAELRFCEGRKAGVAGPAITPPAAEMDTSPPAVAAAAEKYTDPVSWGNWINESIWENELSSSGGDEEDVEEMDDHSSPLDFETDEART